jgi:hypothetical protein
MGEVRVGWGWAQEGMTGMGVAILRIAIFS